MRSSPILPALVAVLCLLNCGPEGPPEETVDGSSMEPVGPGCSELGLMEQVGCYADLAVQGGGIEACDQADHEGVRYQCFAVFAERTEDPAPCRQIPETTEDHLALKDLCLSDVAKVRLDPELCQEIQGPGFKDGCFFGVAQGIPDPNLCTRITDEGLRAECTSSGGASDSPE